MIPESTAVLPAKPSKSVPVMDNDLIVLVGENGFLVVDTQSGEETVVSLTGDELQCDCFIAKVSPDGICDHIQAVQKHQADRIPESSFTQADADYYLSRIARLDAEIGMNQTAAEQQKQRIDAWLAREQDKLERRRGFYLTVLENWMHQAGLTSKRLVHGNLQIRKQPIQIEVIDEGEVLKDPRFQRIVPEKLEIDRRALRDYIKRTGEEPDGVEVKAVPPKFSYKLAEAT